jgi:hypothetical protein
MPENIVKITGNLNKKNENQPRIKENVVKSRKETLPDDSEKSGSVLTAVVKPKEEKKRKKYLPSKEYWDYQNNKNESKKIFESLEKSRAIEKIIEYAKQQKEKAGEENQKFLERISSYMVEKKLNEEVKNLKDSQGVENINIQIEKKEVKKGELIGERNKIIIQGKNLDYSNEKIMELLGEKLPEKTENKDVEEDNQIVEPEDEEDRDILERIEKNKKIIEAIEKILERRKKEKLVK